MEKEMIIEILGDWNPWERDHDAGVYREDYLSRLDRLVLTDQVVAITGVRRSGKSTLMRQFIKRRIVNGEPRTSFLYVNFEEPRFADSLSLEFLQQVYDAYIEIVRPEGVPYVLLDEVQNVPNWERFARALHERKDAHVLVSGSTSRLLSRELGTLLTGRWVELKVFPLDFREFLQFDGLRLETKLDVLSQRVRIRQLLRDYLEFGGFPLVALKGEKKEILRRYFDDIMVRDVAQRHRIRRVDRLNSLARYYLTNFSSCISYRRIAKFIGLSLDSVERFSSYLTDACMVSFVPKFAYSLKEQEVNPRKVYGIDPGLSNVVSFRFSDNIGRLYENLVFLYLMRKGMEVYYYRNKGECDFVVKEGQDVTQVIQVSYRLDENRERELKGLLEAMDAFGLEQGSIITDDHDAREKVNGKMIRFIPLWKWLLEDR